MSFMYDFITNFGSECVLHTKRHALMHAHKNTRTHTHTDAHACMHTYN